MMIPIGILGSAHMPAPSGPAPIEPDSLSGLRYWLTPDNLSGAEGAAISSWPSTIGEGVVQGDTAKQPTITFDEGVRAARFGGGARFLENSSINGGLACNQTMFAVIKQTTSASTDRFIIGVNTGTGVGLKVKSSIPRAGVWGGDWKEVSSGVNIGTGSWAVASMRFSLAASLEARANDAAPVGPTTTTANTTRDRRTQIGATAGSNAFVGDIREVVFYSRALTDEEWAGVHAYLMNKWSIA